MHTTNFESRHDKILWWVFGFFVTGFFGFQNWIPFLNNFYQTFSLSVILFLFSIGLLMYNFINNRKIIFVSNGYSKINFYFLIIIMCEIFISIRTYVPMGQSYAQTIIQSFYYVVALLLCFAFSQEKKINLNCMIRILTRVSIICGIIATIQFISYNVFEFDFLNLYNVQTVATRNNTSRFTVGGSLIYFTAIFSFTKVLNKKYNKYDVINLFLFIIQLIIYSQTRMFTLAFIILFILMILFTPKVNSTVKIIGKLMLLFAFIFGLFLITNIINYITLYFEKDAGISIRFEAIDYFWSQILDKPLFGYGFITSNRKTSTYTIMSGAGGYYFRDDVGIVGFLNEFGFLGGIWFFLLLIKGFIVCRKSKTIDHQILLWLILLFILTMPTLIFVSFGSTYSIVFLSIFVSKLDKKYRNFAPSFSCYDLKERRYQI